MSKNAVRILIYGLVIGGLLALTLVFFILCRGQKTTYNSYNVQIITLTNELETLTEGTPAYEATLAELTRYQGLKANANSVYTVFAFLAYGFSILSLISIGVVIQHSTKYREKQDNSVTA